MEHFVQKEEVFGFTNQETKQEIEAFKRISFEDLPPVLILYLKCFVYDKQGGIQKLLKRIDFQIDLEIIKGRNFDHLYLLITLYKNILSNYFFSI